MILFYSEGRLGNQIFQYAFLKNIAIHNELIVVIDFDDLSNVFELSDKRFLLIRRFKGSKRLYSTIIKPFLSFLASLRLITIIRQDFRYSNGYKCSDDSYTQRKGLLPVKFVENGFFQSERFFSETGTGDLSIKENFINKALSILNKVPAEKHKIFVHVRRGDYINESCLGEKGLTLPLKYYKDCIRWLNDNLDNPFYVFISTTAQH